MERAARVSAKVSLQCFPPGLEAKHNDYLAVPLLSISQHCQAQWETGKFQAAFNLVCFAPGKQAKAEQQQQRITTSTVDPTRKGDQCFSGDAGR